MGLLVGLLPMLGSIFTGFFGTKQAGINALSSTAQGVVSVVNQSLLSDSQKEAAIAQVISADSSSESFLARNWRPAVACILWGMVFAMFAGYNPDVFNMPLTETKLFILETARGCLFGYMPLRSVDKWVGAAMRSRTFNKIIEQVVNKVV